jgi:pimeloyl-ACP methyl ester carboxylesterase
MRLTHDLAGPRHGDDHRLVVLLHAGVADRRMWEPQWEPLTARHRVVRPDLRGFGDTPLPPGPFSHADDIVALLDEIGADGAFVVGASFGGQVALDVAMRAPERVRGLALLAPAAHGYEPTERVQRFGVAEDALLEAGDLDGAVELNVRTWLGPEATAQVADLVRSMQRRAFDVQLAADEAPDPPVDEWATLDPSAIHAPTIVVTGDQDLDWFPLIAADLAARMPAARHLRLPWAGHLPSLERPAAITRLLLDAIASGDGGAPDGAVPVR